MPQVERQSAQLVEMLEGLEDQFVAALADNQIDPAEERGLRSGITLVQQVAMDLDECTAIGIAIVRTGVTSQRSQRLLRHREDRMTFARANEPEAA